MEPRQCEGCDIVLTRRANERKSSFQKRKYHSILCANKMKRTKALALHPDKICPRCNKAIKASDFARPQTIKFVTYCSTKCSNQARYAEIRANKPIDEDKPKAKRIRKPPKSKAIKVLITDTFKVADFKPPVSKSHSIEMIEESSYRKCSCGATANPWTGKCATCHIKSYGLKLLGPKHIEIVSENYV